MTDSIDRERLSLSFERVLEATPAEVFEAWTQPDQVTRWWDPSGAPLVACSIDARAQGAFRFVSAGHAPPFEGVYDVVERPRRLEFRGMGARGVIVLDAHPRGTFMKVSIESPSREHFEMFVKLGVAQGTSATMDNLVRLLCPSVRAASA